MKKILLIISFLSCILIIHSQDIAEVTENSSASEKSTKPILPQAGDLALGIGAQPVLSYFGNLFNGTANNSFLNPSTCIMAKYCISDDLAFVTLLNIANSNNYTRELIRDDAAFFENNLNRDKVEDILQTKSNSITAIVNIQKYRGYGKLKGYYGVGLGYRHSNTERYYKYANPINEINRKPSISPIIASYDIESSRILESDNGFARSAFVSGLAGIEYYFMPKICIGGRVELSYALSWEGQGNDKREKWEGTEIYNFDVEKKARGIRGTALQTNSFTTNTTNYIQSNLYFMFHF